MSEQEPIDDETLWGMPGQSALQSEGAMLPADIDDAEKEAEVIQNNENNEQKKDQE